MNNVKEVDANAIKVGRIMLLSYEKAREDAIARYEGRLQKLQQLPDVDKDKLLRSAFRHQERIKAVDRRIKFTKKLLVEWAAPEAT